MATADLTRMRSDIGLGAAAFKGMAGVLCLLSDSNCKTLRRAPALDALNSRTGFQGLYVLGLLIQV